MNCPTHVSAKKIHIHLICFSIVFCSGLCPVCSFSALNTLVNVEHWHVYMVLVVAFCSCYKSRHLSLTAFDMLNVCPLSGVRNGVKMCVFTKFMFTLKIVFLVLCFYPYHPMYDCGKQWKGFFFILAMHLSGDSKQNIACIHHRLLLCNCRGMSLI